MLALRKGKGFSGSQLKLIAAVSMLADHIGYRLVGYGIWVPLTEAGEAALGWERLYQAPRCAGRLAFPIFAFLLVEGFFHTRSRLRYGLRLGIFALLSEIPFDLLGSGRIVDWGHQNVLLTFLLGLCMLCVLDDAGIRFGRAQQEGANARSIFGQWGRTYEFSLAVQLLAIGGFAALSWGLRADYDYAGIFLIALFYWLKQEPVRACLAGWFWMCLTTETWYYGSGYVLAFLAISQYNGSRGQERGRYFFYLFYPLHMLILWGIGTAMG